jgi:catechol 2,3-dioxygenase-like lactoylglutathione lyase family enzyme
LRELDGQDDQPMAKLSRIALEIPVSNLRESIEYYEQKLGFRVVMELPGGDYAIVERDEIAIHLFQDEARRHSPVGMHIFTHQLDELHAELKQRGAHLSQEIMRKPWGNRDFRVNDPSENEIKFTEPLPDDA